MVLPSPINLLPGRQVSFCSELVATSFSLLPRRNYEFGWLRSSFEEAIRTKKATQASSLLLFVLVGAFAGFLLIFHNANKPNVLQRVQTIRAQNGLSSSSSPLSFRPKTASSRSSSLSRAIVRDQPFYSVGNVNDKALLRRKSMEIYGGLKGRHAALQVRAQENEVGEPQPLPWYFDVGTKGGALVVPIFTVVFPLAIYYGLQANGKADLVVTKASNEPLALTWKTVPRTILMSAEKAGPWASFLYLFGGLMAWTFTYLYRVATKNMTYVQQLKDYEDAVMMKRLEEMSDDELLGMLEDAERTATEFQKQMDAEQSSQARA
eukprot:jgi/Bigna1/84909/estExt_fgenesh1_pg.C_10342